MRVDPEVTINQSNAPSGFSYGDHTWQFLRSITCNSGRLRVRLKVNDDGQRVVADALLVQQNSGFAASSLPELHDDIENASPLRLYAGEYLYIDSDQPFHAIEFANAITVDSGTGAVLGLNSIVAALELTVWDGSSWISLSFDDSVSHNGAPFGVERGRISFVKPDDWTPINDSGDMVYRARVRVSRSLDTVNFAEIYTVSLKSEFNEVEQIMAAAPAPWSLDLSGYKGTALGVDLRMTGQNIVEGLSQVARASGTRIRINKALKTVTVLRQDKEHSGVHAVKNNTGSLDGHPSVCYLRSLRRRRETYGIPTRIELFGGGRGSARVDLSKSTAPAPNGYAVDRGQSILRLNPEPTPRKTKRIVLSEIVGDEAGAIRCLSLG